MSHLYPYPLSNEGADVKITAEGGIARRYINRTGAPTIKGLVVQMDNANDDSVKLSPTDTYDPIGIFYENGVADGSWTWIVTGGVADIRLDANTGANSEDWIGVSSSEAGHCQAIAIPSANNQLHFRELGHATKAVAAPGPGNHALVRTVLHFN